MLKPDQVRKTSLHKQEEVCVCVCARVHTHTHTHTFGQQKATDGFLHERIARIKNVLRR